VDALNIAKKICLESKNKGSVSIDDFQRIISSYERSLKSTMKITKMSDCQQIYLQEIQEKLQKEIEERKKVEEKLKYFAYTDYMTGVSNRRAGFALIEQELKKCLKEHSYFSISFIDIDKLKAVNDNYGHAEGDYLINAIVRIIKEFVKDIRYISRIGGDEFMVIFPNCYYDDAQKVIDKILEKVQEFNDKKLKPYNISFSYGIKDIDESTIISTEDEIIKIADTLMYKNKTSKKLK
jgi:diguanylate cyclase (GGDEF) domain